MARYQTYMIDPSWPERGGGKIKRGADRHYQVVKTLPAMTELILTSSAWQSRAPNVHLYFWATNNYMEWAYYILKAMGAKRHVDLPWVKPGRMGIGQYFRGCHEACIFATVGKGFAVRKPGTFRSDALVGAEAPKDARGQRIHSAKPQAAYDLAQARSHGPYMEMFARADNPHAGWDVWGNEAHAMAKPKRKRTKPKVDL